MSSFKGVLEILVRKFSYFDFIDCLVVLSTPKSGILKQKETFYILQTKCVLGEKMGKLL